MMRYHIFRHTHLILWGMGLIIPNSMVSASEFLMKIALFGGMIPIWIDQVAIRLDSRISATQTVVQQQTWRCELWANCTKMEVWIDPGVFLTHLWKPWISLIKVWASKLQHTGDVEKASIWQGRCIAQLLWIELLQIQRGNGTSPMYKWFTMIYLLTKMTIVHCYVKYQRLSWMIQTFWCRYGGIGGIRQPLDLQVGCFCGKWRKIVSFLRVLFGFCKFDGFLKIIMDFGWIIVWMFLDLWILCWFSGGNPFNTLIGAIPVA